MLVVYIAGPFTGPTAWDIEQNVRRAEEAGFVVATLGAMPLIPHANTRYFHGQQSAEFWYEGTLELLRRCDGILMVKGWMGSKGSMTEHAYAQKHGMPIFYMDNIPDLDAMMDWVKVAGDEHHVQNNFDRKLSRDCGSNSNRSGHPRSDSDHREEPG